MPITPAGGSVELPFAAARRTKIEAWPGHPETLCNPGKPRARYWSGRLNDLPTLTRYLRGMIPERTSNPALFPSTPEVSRRGQDSQAARRDTLPALVRVFRLCR